MTEIHVSDNRCKLTNFHDQDECKYFLAPFEANLSQTMQIATINSHSLKTYCNGFIVQIHLQSKELITC